MVAKCHLVAKDLTELFVLDDDFACGERRDAIVEPEELLSEARWYRERDLSSQLGREKRSRPTTS